MTWPVAACLLLVVVGCTEPGPTPTPIESPTPSVEETTLVDITDLTWDGDTLILVSAERSGFPWRYSFIQAVAPWAVAEPLAAGLRGCESVRLGAPTVESSLLRYVKTCLPSRELFLAELDLDTLSERPVVTSLEFPPNAYVSPDGGQTWLGSNASGFCAWISRIAGAGGPWPITVADGPRPFQVDESLVQPDCDRTGLAGFIAQAPDSTIAILASSSSVNLTGRARFDARWRAYLVANDGSTTPFGPEFQRPTQIHWHPDGEHLTISGRIDGRRGLWSVGRDGELRFLYEGPVLDFAWAPDGRRLAAIVEAEGPLSEATKVVMIEPDPPLSGLSERRSAL